MYSHRTNRHEIRTHHTPECRITRIGPEALHLSAFMSPLLSRQRRRARTHGGRVSRPLMRGRAWVLQEITVELGIGSTNYRSKESASGWERHCPLDDARRLVEGYVKHHNNVRLNSAIARFSRSVWPSKSISETNRRARRFQTESANYAESGNQNRSTLSKRWSAGSNAQESIPLTDPTRGFRHDVGAVNAAIPLFALGVDFLEAFSDCPPEHAHQALMEELP